MGNDALTARSPLVVTNTTSVTGKLALNAPLITSLNVVNIGNGSTSNPGATFQKNLRIANLSGALQSFQSGTLNVGSEGVALFPGKFATASKSKEAVSNSLSNCGSSCVHWEKLTRKDGNNGIYLVYGESANSASCTSDEDVVDRCEHDDGDWDYEHCTCICPQGTYWSDAQGACISECENEQQNIDLCTDASYSGTGYTGTWNQDTCTCTCQSGSHWEDGEGCVGSSCQWILQGYEAGFGVSDYNISEEFVRLMEHIHSYPTAYMGDTNCYNAARELEQSFYAGNGSMPPASSCNKTNENFIRGVYQVSCEDHTSGGWHLVFSAYECWCP